MPLAINWRDIADARDAAQAETRRLRNTIRSLADDLAKAREAHLDRTNDFDGIAADCGAAVVALRALANGAAK